MSTSRVERAVGVVFPGLVAVTLLAGALFPASPRTFQILVFGAMLGALWATGWRLARWLTPDWEPLSRAVAAFTFAVGIAVVPATWMGHFAVLRPPVFLVWTAAAYLVSRLLPDKRAAVELVPQSPVAMGPSHAIRIQRALLFAAALAIAWAGLLEIRGARYLPPISFDDLSYHLSTVATWIRYGDLRMIRFAVGDPSTPFYPILGEMAAWVLIAPFRDSDFAARWTQLFFAGFSFVAAAAVASRLGLARRDAALAALAYAGIPEAFPSLALTAGNDHSLSFFTLAALDGSLALARRPHPGAAVATGTAFGLLLATKYVGVLFAPVVLAALILAFWVERRQRAPGMQRAPVRSLAGLAALLATTIALTGGYTYLRNWVTTENPIFPAPVRILGIEVFPGWWGILPTERNGSTESQIDVWRFLTGQPDLLGSYFRWTLLPAVLLAPLLALARRRWREVVVFSLPTVFFLQFVFLMSDHRSSRYFLPGIALAAVAFAWLLSQWGLRASPLRIALLLWIVWQALGQLEWKGTTKALAAVAFVAAGALLELGRRRWRTFRPSALPPFGFAGWGRIAAAALLVMTAVPLGRAVLKYQGVKLAERPAALALERFTGSEGARIAYAGLNAPYLFFGSRLQNHVEIVPRRRALEPRVYRWGSRLAQPYAMGSYRQWRANLARLGIQFVVVHRSPWENPERRWLIRQSRDFKRVFADTETEIWQVLPDPERQGLTNS
ncbi:MAG TPA: hypothetical protein VGG03_21655 [Thermoanaerobaculia bacterium]|jgi:hypothetical protein